MDPLKYSVAVRQRKLTNFKPHESEQGKKEVTLCPPDCWLRGYKPPQAVPESIEFTPYDVKPSDIYRRIKSTQIRILRIHPGKKHEAIVTELLNARFTGLAGTVEIDIEDELIVQYRTLSYSWGYGGSTKSIKCNNVDFEVLENLYWALLELRHTDDYMYYWIDAICINQPDPDEKAVQISKMFALYSQAIETVVWLGPSAQCGFEAYRFLVEFEEYQHSQECIQALASVCMGLNALAERPWFQRIWVRQEVFASQLIKFRIGTNEIEYNVLRDKSANALSWLQRLKSSSNTHSTSSLDTSGLEKLLRNLNNFGRVDAGDSQNLIARNYAALSQKPDLSLERVLRGNSSFRATNARDFIYGIISMTSVPTYLETAPEGSVSAFQSYPDKTTQTSNQDKAIPSLPIHYARPLAQVFSEATMFMIQFHKSLDVIFLNSQLSPYEQESFQLSGIKDTILPSWAVDWRQSSQWSFLDSVWLLMDELIWRYGPTKGEGTNRFQTNAARKASNILKIQDLQPEGGCSIRRKHAAWNDRESFRDFSKGRIIFGSQNCSAFSDIRKLMYTQADFKFSADNEVVKLQCVGAVLGVLNVNYVSELKDTKFRHDIEMMNLGRNKPRILRMSQASSSLQLTGYYIEESVEYMKFVTSDVSQDSFKNAIVMPVDGLFYRDLSKRPLFRSEKPLARYREYDSGKDENGWPISQFCYHSDMGRILAASSCLVPRGSQNGDLVVILRGSSLPAILRSTKAASLSLSSDMEEFELIGPLIHWHYVAEESLRRTHAELWQKYSDDYEFFPDLERKPAPLEEDLPMKTFVIR